MEDKYRVGDISLARIRNKNELRVISLIPKALAEYGNFQPDQLDIEDIYALTLNNLTPRYVQIGSIVIHEEITDNLIMEKLRESIKKVQSNPNH